MNTLDTIAFFKTLRETIDSMSDEDVGALMKALFAHDDGEEVDLSGKSVIVKVVFPIVAEATDRLNGFRAKKSMAGKAKRSTTVTQTEQKRNTTVTDAEQNGNTTATLNHSHIRKESILTDTKEKKFTPPTVEEVAAYASEKGYHMEAERFVDFYASKGWKVGNTPMKDWKAAVRNWATRDNNRKADKPVFNFDQRGTDYDALLRNMG